MKTDKKRIRIRLMSDMTPEDQERYREKQRARYRASGRDGREKRNRAMRLFLAKKKSQIALGLRGAAESDSPEHQAWTNMLSRCYNENAPNYHRYGGRGITVCEEWRESYSAFLRDMGRKTSPDLSIDRIDNDGIYEPGNCRWATARENTRNRSCALVVMGRPLKEWADILGVGYDTLRSRLKRGWPEEAVIASGVSMERP